MSAVRALAVVCAVLLGLVPSLLAGPAGAATTVVLSGRLVDSTGAPVGGVVVWSIEAGDEAQDTTDSQGRFSVPTASGQSTRLHLAWRYEEPGSGYMEDSASLEVWASAPAVRTNTDLGDLLWPAVQRTRFRVEDSVGTPVDRAYGDLALSEVDDWADGTNLLDGMTVQTASFVSATYSEPYGSLDVYHPRMADDSVPVTRIHADGTDTSTATATATGTDPAVVRVPGMRVGPPRVSPYFDTSSYVYAMSLTSARVHFVPFEEAGARVLGYSVVLAPGGRAGVVDPLGDRAVFTDLTVGQEYRVTVIAHSRAGDASRELRDSFRLMPLKPKQPARLAVDVSRAVPRATWRLAADSEDAPVDAWALTVLSASGVEEVATRLDGTARSLALEGLAPGASYRLRLVGTNASGEGTAAEVAFTTPRAGVPERTATPVARVAGSRVVLRWAAPKAGAPVVTKYRVVGLGRKTRVARSRRLVVTGMAPGTYRVRVVAVNARGAGPASKLVRVVVRRR